jgi:hypothetical protein
MKKDDLIEFLSSTIVPKEYERFINELTK